MSFLACCTQVRLISGNKNAILIFKRNRMVERIEQMLFEFYS